MGDSFQFSRHTILHKENMSSLTSKMIFSRLQQRVLTALERVPLAGQDFNETAQLTSVSCTSAQRSSVMPTSRRGDADYGPAVKSSFMNLLLGGLDLHFPLHLQEGGLGHDSASLCVCRLAVPSCSWDSHHRRASWGLLFP